MPLDNWVRAEGALDRWIADRRRSAPDAGADPQTWPWFSKVLCPGLHGSRWLGDRHPVARLPGFGERAGDRLRAALRPRGQGACRDHTCSAEQLEPDGVGPTLSQKPERQTQGGETTNLSNRKIGEKIDKNGAKRTRTADPLHAMQVLYQLSYGPVGIDWLSGRWSPGLARGPCRVDVDSLHRSGSAPAHPGAPCRSWASDLAPDRHQPPLHTHLIGRQHDRLVSRIGRL